MEWSADDERRVSRAMANARDILLSMSHDDPAGSDIVFTTLCYATDVERRQRVRGVAPLDLKAMKIDYTREKEEYLDDLKQRMIEIAAGDPPDEVFGCVVQPNPQEIDTMESIKMVFRSCLVGKLQERDWRILYMLTMPKATTTKVGRIIHIPTYRVADRKLLQCKAIWMRVQHLLPARRVGGVVWAA